MSLSTYEEQMIQQIKNRNETVYLTVGFRWKNPTTMDVPMTPDKAIEWIQTGTKYYALIELNDRQGKLCLNAYTANDMW